VLKALLGFVSEKLSSAPSSHPTLRILGERVQSSLATLLFPEHCALFSDPLPARDVAFSLARLCIGMKEAWYHLLFSPSCYLLRVFNLFFKKIFAKHLLSHSGPTKKWSPVKPKN